MDFQEKVFFYNINFNKGLFYFLVMGALEIFRDSEHIVEAIFEYSRLQRGIWRRVPLLALRADGRRGFSDEHNRAYREFWVLGRSLRDEVYTVCVDLSNGELVDARLVYLRSIVSRAGLKPAKMEEVLKLAFSLEELDAERIVKF